jgi:dihydroflavonol-4-reductase
LKPTAPEAVAELRDVDGVFADIRDANAVAQAMRDCDVVLHTAGPVGVWGSALEKMHAIHTDGLRHVLRALPAHARLVHTSSVTTIGASTRAEVLTETAPFHLQHLRVDYVQAKKAAEGLALDAAGQGRDVVVVNPGYLIGPGDIEGSIMGQVCMRYWRGKMPLIPPGGLNFVDVRDVARGHLLAAEHGVPGRRYILGGDNLTMREFARQLAQVRGMPARWLIGMPRWFYTLLSQVAEMHARSVGRIPYPSRQHARVSSYDWYFSSERAIEELGYESRPVAVSLDDAHAWYCTTGRLRPPSNAQVSSADTGRRAA